MSAVQKMSAAWAGPGWEEQILELVDRICEQRGKLVLLKVCDPTAYGETIAKLRAFQEQLRTYLMETEGVAEEILKHREAAKSTSQKIETLRAELESPRHGALTN